MILPLVILYVITLVYLAITERFRNFASIIGLQGWILFAVALLRLHAINPLELIFIAIETLAFKALLVPAILFAMIRKTKINRVRRSGSSQSGSLLLSLMALAVSASITYYIALLNVGMNRVNPVKKETTLPNLIDISPLSKICSQQRILHRDSTINESSGSTLRMTMG